jgi:hypothetical protein
MNNAGPLPIWLYYQHEMTKTWEEVKAKLVYLDMLAINYGHPDIEDGDELKEFQDTLEKFKNFGSIYFEVF